MQENFGHYSVLLNETVDSLNIKENGIYVDCTLGGAGHSNEILKRLGPDGILVGIDRDTYALEKAKERLSAYKQKIILIKGNFCDASELLKITPEQAYSIIKKLVAKKKLAKECGGKYARYKLVE